MGPSPTPAVREALETTDTFDALYGVLEIHNPTFIPGAASCQTERLESSSQLRGE